MSNQYFPENPEGVDKNPNSSSPYQQPGQNAPYGQQFPQSGPHDSPYGGQPSGQYDSYQQPSQSNPYSNSGYAQPNGPAKKEWMGLAFEKNVVPNPATNGHSVQTPKSVGLAYVLWFFLGWVGVHQFYLGNTQRGLFNLLLWAVTVVVGFVGIPLGLLYFAYWVYEGVTLKAQTEEINAGYIRKSIL